MYLQGWYGGLGSPCIREPLPDCRDFSGRGLRKPHWLFRRDILRSDLIYLFISFSPDWARREIYGEVCLIRKRGKEIAGVDISNLNAIFQSGISHEEEE